MLVMTYKKLTGLFIVFSIAYLLLSILLPLDKASLAKYHLTSGSAAALTFTVTIPYLVIWFIALVGYLRLKAYTEAIGDGKDGEAFAMISKGILCLSLWLPVSALIGSATTGYFHANHSSTPLMINLNNYANLIILFPAFLLVNLGSKKLLTIIRKPEAALPQTIMMVFIGFSALYVFLVLRDPARQFPTHSVSTASYYLPDWLIVTTIIIPRLITWFLGVQAIHNIYLYRNKIKGLIYKDALKSLANGIGGVVLTVVVLRCFQSLSSQLNQLSLSLILLIVYLLLILISIGYILIAKGAKSLQKIEEI
jgi:hypothetical protein